MYVENIHSNSWLNHIGHSIFHQWFSSINHLMGMCKKENRYHTVQSMVAANQCCRESGALIWRACIILSYYDKSRVKTGHSCSGVIRHKWNISRIHNPCQKKGQTPNMKWKECLSCNAFLMAFLVLQELSSILLFHLLWITLNKVSGPRMQCTVQPLLQNYLHLLISIK